MDWKEKIAVGMKMIIEGCDGESFQFGCKGCPFGPICSIILLGENSDYSTPDNWEKEGIFKKSIDIS